MKWQTHKILTYFIFYHSVGLKISTKRPFVDTGTVYDLRWDITDTYKFDEGTQAERDAVAMARRTVAGNLMAGTNPPENKVNNQSFAPRSRIDPDKNILNLKLL